MKPHRRCISQQASKTVPFQAFALVKKIANIVLTTASKASKALKNVDNEVGYARCTGAGKLWRN
jgi:hypothetical protein